LKRKPNITTEGKNHVEGTEREFGVCKCVTNQRLGKSREFKRIMIRYSSRGLYLINEPTPMYL